MTDVIVRPEGPLARGSDRRASITVQPGGSAANQAAWLASFGVKVDFVARVGAADVETRDSALQGDRRHAASRRRSRTRDRAADRAHRPGRRTQLPHRSRRQRSARSPRHPGRADRGRGAHPSLRLFVLRPFAARGRPRRHAARGGQAHQRRSGVGGILARGRRRRLSRLDARRGNPVPQRRGSRDSRGLDDPETQCARLAAHYPLVVIKRGAAGAKRLRAKSAGVSTRRRSRRSTPPARATPSSPPFSPRDCPARTSSPRSSAPQQPAPPLRQSSAAGRKAASVHRD